MIDQNPYRVLGVSEQSGADEIRAAYFALARAHHPDLVGDNADAETMRQINLAYEQLSDPTRQANIDPKPEQSGPTLDELGELFDLHEMHESFTSLPRYKLAALNRETVMLESEGWTVERRHDHLIARRLAGRRFGIGRLRRAERISVTVDRDGLVDRWAL